MDYKKEYKNWLEKVTDKELLCELNAMTEVQQEDAFYRNLAFGTGGLRGTIGAGTNRMNIYVVAKASQGLANYLLKTFGDKASVVIGYDSRIKSDIFARTAASVFAANGIKVHLWPELNPVPTVSFATRELKASAGVMITASHNPSKYNGYKVYGPDGCQITTEAAAAILAEIEKLDIFSDVKMGAFDDIKQGLSDGVKQGTSDNTDSKNVDLSDKIEYIDPSVLTSFIEEVKGQSVLFGDEINRDVAIVYSPLNGTGLKPVTRALQESGFTNITVVEEQRNPDGNFPTCPYPNPEIREAMELGLEYCKKTGADLLLATDPDADRCGIAIKVNEGFANNADSTLAKDNANDINVTKNKDKEIVKDRTINQENGVTGIEPQYRLLSGNEVGLLLLDYICSQRVKHGKMPEKPVFVKTIVTMDLAERIAENYDVETVNVLTGFKFIGEVIGKLEAQGREKDYICGFEESYGYLTGTYVRDKDAVNAAFMICEMFAYYKTRGIDLLCKLQELYDKYGYCLNTLHSFEFPGSSGMQKMADIMAEFHKGLDTIAGMKVTKTEDYSQGLNGLPKSDVLKFYYKSADGVSSYNHDADSSDNHDGDSSDDHTCDKTGVQGSVVVRPSGTEPKLKVYISVTAENKEKAEKIEKRIQDDFKKVLES